MIYNNLSKRAVNDFLKISVLNRDGYLCCYCGVLLTFQTAHMDHARPRSKGGLTNLDNLRSSCSGCNFEKGDKIELEYWTYKSQKRAALNLLASWLGGNDNNRPY